MTCGWIPRPSTTFVPVLAGSRTDWRVADPVVLFGSAVEVKIPDKAVARAVLWVADGAVGDETGHTPASVLPGCSCPRTWTATRCPVSSKTPPPELPGPALPTSLTVAQKVES